VDSEKQNADLTDFVSLGFEHVFPISAEHGRGFTELLDQAAELVTGLTLSGKQAEYANRQIGNAGLEESARVLQQSYKDLPTDEKAEKFDRIICMEMIEHVGLKNLGAFYEKVCELLTDDGVFLLQWTGLRRGLRPEDLIWGLFVGKYVFPGADAALPPSAMLKAMEKAGLELHSIENISGHYAETLAVWRRNWVSNRGAVLAAYGERWFRIWNFFLAWSMLVAEQGHAGCYQAVLNKNLEGFDRQRWGVRPATVRRLRDRDSEVPESSPRPLAGDTTESSLTASE
jgi:cyclopropane fatty-acyl-phospholipid synthase-like methyltransferase